MLMSIPALILALLMALTGSGCGQVPSTLELQAPQVQTQDADPVVTAQPLATATPEPSSSPSPAPSVAPVTLLSYTSNQVNSICNALHAWNSATTSIKITYPAGYFYTFEASGVTITQSGSTGSVSSDTLAYGNGPTCSVTIFHGQVTAIN